MHAPVAPTIVRVATAEDEAGILALCWLSHKERNERTPSERKALEMIRSCFAGNGIIGVIDHEGKLGGIVGLVKSAMWGSEDIELYDWLVYVRPECRHLRYLTPLLSFAKRQAIETGLVLWMGFIGDERTEAKARAYHRHFSKYGEYFRFDPRTQAT